MRRLVLTGKKPSLGRFLACAFAACSFLAGTHAHAGIAATSANVNVITAPTGTVSTDSLEDDNNVTVWFESRVTTPGAQALDHVGAGLVNSTVLLGSPPNPQTETPGEALSYMIHIDQQTDAGAITFSESITFTMPIVGLWFSTSTGTGLGGSDGQWSGATTYGTLASRDWELSPIATNRNFSISNDLLTLTLNQDNLANEVDQIRVLVNPEPSTGVLAGLGVLGLAALVRRRRRERDRAHAAA